MGQIFGVQPWKVVAACIPVVVMWAVESGVRNWDLLRKLQVQPVPLRWGMYYAVVTGILLFGTFGAKAFIYFQF
jgi:hypothetical protein